MTKKRKIAIILPCCIAGALVLACVGIWLGVSINEGINDNKYYSYDEAVQYAVDEFGLDEVLISGSSDGRNVESYYVCGMRSGEQVFVIVPRERAGEAREEWPLGYNYTQLVELLGKTYPETVGKFSSEDVRLIEGENNLSPYLFGADDEPSDIVPDVYFAVEFNFYVSEVPFQSCCAIQVDGEIVFSVDYVIQ